MQLTVSVVLVHSTLFLVEDLVNLTRVDVGMDADDIHVYGLNGHLPQRELGDSYFRALTSELQAVPGVDAVGLTGTLPPLSFLRDLTRPVQSEEGTEANVVLISTFPGVFDAWRTKHVSGRSLTWADGSSAVVTESLARRLYPDQVALGHQIQTDTLGAFEIVGVVGNMAYNGPRLGIRNVMFIPYLKSRNPWPSTSGAYIYVRSRRTLADLGQDVRRVVDRLGVHYVRSMND